MLNIEIIVGAHNTGKTTFLYDRIKKHSLNLKNESILIVPDQTTFYHEKKLIKHLDKDGIINIQVLSLRRLAYIILSEVGGLKKPAINDYGKMMLIRRILSSNKEQLKLYQKSYQQQGLLKEMNQLINEFKSGGISPEFLEAINSNMKQENLFSDKINDIKLIFEALNVYLEENFLDDEDILSLSTKRMKDSKYVKDALIVIDGFEEMSVAEKDFIKELSEYANQIYVSVALSPKEDKEEYEISKFLLDDLIKRLTNEGKAPRVKFLDYTEKTMNDIGFLSEYFFDYASNVYENKPNNINMIYCLNPNEEVEKTSNNIIRDVRDLGLQWKDIAVVLSEETVYKHEIERVFSEYEIPYFFNSTRDIKNHPLIVMILSIIDIVLWHYQQNDVTRFLKCGYTELTWNEIEELENFAIKYGIKGYKWKREFRANDKANHQLEENARRYTMDLLKKVDSLKDKGTVSEKVIILTDFLNGLNVYDNIRQESSQLKKKDMHEKAFENSQVWNATMEIFEQLINISGDMELNLMEFRDVLKAGFESYTIRIIPPSEDSVFVGTINSFFSGTLESVYFLGLNEGLMPSVYRDKGILHDEEREILREKGAFLKKTAHYIMNEKYKFGTILAHSGRKISFSWSLADKEGKALRPSIYMNRIKTMFPHLIIDGGVIQKKEIPERIKPLFNYMAEAVRNYLNGKDFENTDLIIYQWLEREQKDFFELLSKSINYENKAEINELKYLDRLYGKNLNMSPYSIESFNSCPFKFFLEYGLKLRERPEYKIEFKNMGTIFHQAMEQLTEEIINDNSFIFLENDKILEAAERFVEASLTQDSENLGVFEENERSKYIWTRIKEMAKQSALNLVLQLQKSEFRPMYKELGFGINEQDINAIAIPIDRDKTVFLRGVIDRIDICKIGDAFYVNIIDYKSSEKSVSLSDAYNGIQIQLFLYMDALLKNNSKLFENKGLFGGAFYFHINDQLVDGDQYNGMELKKALTKRYSLQGYVIDDLEVVKKMDTDFSDNKASELIKGMKLKGQEEFAATSRVINRNAVENLCLRIEKNIKDAASDILNGKIEISPYSYKNKKPCTYCKYISVCQFDNTLHTNKYRKLSEYKDKDIIEILSEEDIND